MPTTRVYKFRTVGFRLGGVDQQYQLTSGKLVNNTPDGEKLYVFALPTDPAGTGEIREDAEPDYALELKFFADWRPGGISDYLTQNDQQTITFYFDHHAEISGEHVRWTGTCKAKAPTVGGDVRTNEMTEVTLAVFGKPTYARIP